jgi:hypothetical protein
MKTTLGMMGVVAVLGIWLAGGQPAAAQALEGGGVSPPGNFGQAGVAGDAKSTGARPYLGARVDDTVDRGRGVRVLSVTPGGPADRAGLKPDDLITTASGARIRQLADLTAVLDSLGPGDRLPLEAMRGGRPVKGEIVLGQASAATAPSPPSFVPGGPGSGIPSEGPVLTPVPSSGDSARIDQLQRRIEQLERRVEALERQIDSQKPPASR